MKFGPLEGYIAHHYEPPSIEEQIRKSIFRMAVLEAENRELKEELAEIKSRIQQTSKENPND